MKEECLEVSEGYARLQNIVSKIDTSTLKVKKDTSNKFVSLDFKFDSAIDPDWIYSGYKEGSLAVNEEGYLSITIFSGKDESSRSQIIFSSLKSFELIEKFPYYFTLEIESKSNWKKQFVFFLPDRDAPSYAYAKNDY